MTLMQEHHPMLCLGLQWATLSRRR